LQERLYEHTVFLVNQADLFASPLPAPPPRPSPPNPLVAAVLAAAEGVHGGVWDGRDAGDAAGAVNVMNAAGIGQRPDLHPAVWRAHELGRPVATDGRQAIASGHRELDRELPGGGWPLSVLTELLLPHDGLGELRLLAPALAAVQRRSQASRGLMWFDPPAEPCAWVLAALGLDLRQLVVVRARPALAGLAGRRPGQRRAARAQLPAADVLWALEQALKSGEAGAVVAWLPARLPADALRRLQLAAQAHPGPAFLLRPASEARQPSAAPLRITLASAGPDRLRLVLLKRRGPPCAGPVTLALPPVLHGLPQPVLLPPSGPAGPTPPGARDSGLQAA
jgi:protein ImuA